jgi:hypothetical protein
MIDTIVTENIHVCIIVIGAIIVLSSLRSPGPRYRRRTCQTDVDALIRASSAAPITKSGRVPLPSQGVRPTVGVATRHISARRRGGVAAARAALALIALLGLPAWSFAGPGNGATNLLANPDFEVPVKGTKPVAWDFFASDGNVTANLVDGPARAGHQALLISAMGKPKSFGGAVQVLDVMPGQKYSMTAFVHACDTNPLDGTAYGQLVVEWQESDGTEISRVWGRAWGRNLSRVRWQKVDIDNVVAPEYASRAVFGIHLYDGAGTSKGSVIVDDVSVTTPGGSRLDVVLGADLRSKFKRRDSK